MSRPCLSGALVSGAHENMPYRVVGARVVMFLSFTSSQVVYINATACLKTTNIIRHTPDTEDTRPEDSSVYRRSKTGYRAAHFILLPLITPPRTLRPCVGPNSLIPKTNRKGGDVVGEFYNDLRFCDYRLSCSVLLTFLENLSFRNEQFDAF